jgi:preprotein translocase subunit YajC
MWIELGLFFLVLIFAIHQIRDVRKEQRKRAEREQVEKNALK